MFFVRRFYRSLLIFFLLVANLSFANNTNIELKQDTKLQLESPYVEFFVDPSGELSLSQLLRNQPKFQPLTKEQINRSLSTDSFWLKFTLNNDSENDLNWVVYHESSYLDELTVYTQQPNGEWHNVSVSDHLPFELRSYPYPKLNIEQTLTANTSQQVLINLRMLDLDTITLGLHLSSDSQFAKTLANEQMFQGLYFGATLTLLFVALILWIKLQSLIHFYYVTFLAVSTIFWSFVTGYFFQYMTPNAPHIFNQGFHVIYLLFFIAALQFSKFFLSLNKFNPTIFKALSLLQLLACLGIVLRFMGYYEPVLHLSFIGLALLALLPVLGVYSYRKGNKAAKWYVAAWGVYGSAIVISVLSASTDWFDWGMQPLLYTQVAGLLESILLAFAVADRIAQLKTELYQVTEESQRDALTRLGNRRMMNAHFTALQHSQDINSNYWVMVIDIDDFKDVNDKHGHEAGDIILKNLAEILTHSCGSNECAIRYGGEEFLLFLQANDLQALTYTVHRIKDAIAYHTFVYEDISMTITASLGIAKLNPATEPLELSIKNADKALYYVKKSEKNKVALHQTNGEIEVLEPIS